MKYQSIIATEKRRAIQPLWNALDAVVRPYLSGGIVLCVSGGADSRALMESIARWKHRGDGCIHVISIDHGVRAESSIEVKAVIERARALGFGATAISITCERPDEATMRKRRYDAIWSEAARLGIPTIVTAHQEDDEAESFVMDLFGLGGGHEGSSMSFKTAMSNGSVLRPFLELSRPQLLMALTAMDAVDYFSDPTNEIGDAQRTTVRRFLNANCHPDSRKRLALISRRRALDVQAIAREAQKIMLIHPDGGIRIPIDDGISGAILAKAISIGLRSLSPNSDLRQSRVAIDMIVHQALDRGLNSFTVQGQFRRFDLSGATAVLSMDGIRLQMERAK